MLGTIAKLDDHRDEGLRSLLRFIDPANVDDYDDAADMRRLGLTARVDIDALIVDVARGRYPALTLRYTADDVEHERRAARLEHALNIPVPADRRNRIKFAPGSETYAERRKYAVGPESTPGTGLRRLGGDGPALV